ncbi:hypothetical protein TrVE_jg11449 [Triparma verrucosa]|uniref:Glycoside hydrolase family 28 protein n=1 Tax=Triparma verrucosa TaxID=1606542 RepID=A0A9W7C4V8_9STRA|nr:hypothetical protein TrVE_jg11449 [Triparma verrucosa]
MFSKLFFALISLALTLLSSASAGIIDFEEAGGVAGDNSLKTCWQNGALINSTLASLQPGDTFVFPNKTFHVMGGLCSDGLTDVTISFDGTLVFSNDIDSWPKNENGDVFPSLIFNSPKNVIFTSSGKGTLDGQGGKWWGLPGIGYLRRQENRPRLFEIASGENILVENIFFLNSAYWTFWVHDVKGLEVRFCDIEARRTEKDKHTLIDITAFNTDGYDVTGRDVWIHDCTVWNQDDTIAVKDDSQNMLFERITASGVGLTIGSIGSSTVKNITFRDCHMHNTYKGIYTKFRGEGGVIEDVTYENIIIENPSQWPIWIGPAQQSDSNRLCAAHPCSICWPTVPFAECNAADSQYKNILLKNITVIGGKMSPGVIMGGTSEGMGMENIVFDDVVFQDPSSKPWGDDYYKCEGVTSGVAKGKTWPVPPCFDDQTDKN